MGIAAAAIPLGLEIGGRITPFQADLIVIGGVIALVVSGVLWWVSNRFKHIENNALAQNIPTLLADMDIRREEIIQNELDRRMGSGDVDFAFDIIRDIYVTLVGNNLPELPTRVGDEDEDPVERLKLLIEFIPKAKNGVMKVQEQTAKRGEEETGLLVARSVNRYLSIDDRVENDRSYKKLKKKLKTAREHLPSAVASNTTKAIDNYLDASKSYKAPVIVIVPLAKMLEENDLLRGEPFVKQIIDIFQRYRDQYVRLMNEKLAKVNEALGKSGLIALEKEKESCIEVYPFPGKRSPYERDKKTAWAALKVKNTSSEVDLENVSVQILELMQVFERKDDQGIGIYSLHEPYPRWTPANIYWSERNAPANQFEITIPRGATRLALIAFHLENGPALGYLNTPKYPPMLESRIVIEVSSPSMNTWQGVYYIEYVPPSQDKFEFIEWDLWRKSHNVID